MALTNDFIQKQKAQATQKTSGVPTNTPMDSASFAEWARGIKTPVWTSEPGLIKGIGNDLNTRADKVGDIEYHVTSWPGDDLPTITEFPPE